MADKNPGGERSGQSSEETSLETPLHQKTGKEWSSSNQIVMEEKKRETPLDHEIRDLDEQIERYQNFIDKPTTNQGDKEFAEKFINELRGQKRKLIVQRNETQSKK